MFNLSGGGRYWMAKAVFYHKADSEYDDQIERFYHFPRQYLSRVEKTIGDQIIYYGPQDKIGRTYFATASVLAVRADENLEDHFYADVTGFINFDRPVDYRESGGFERKLVRPDGSVSGGRAVQAVRIIEQSEFAAIVEAGLSTADEWPDHADQIDANVEFDGFEDEIQAEYQRPIVQQLLDRPFRDAKFRQHVRKAYNRRNAFTGLRLINGLGRPEVQAAHIKPVDKGGSDSIRNGIALSATAHWMFDRGLLSLEDDFSIMKSRHLNHDVSHLIVSNMKALVPEDPRQQPHPYYLDWHRTYRFKT